MTIQVTITNNDTDMSRVVKVHGLMNSSDGFDLGPDDLREGVILSGETRTFYIWNEKSLKLSEISYKKERETNE